MRCSEPRRKVETGSFWLSGHKIFPQRLGGVEEKINMELRNSGKEWKRVSVYIFYLYASGF